MACGPARGGGTCIRGCGAPAVEDAVPEGAWMCRAKGSREGPRGRVMVQRRAIMGLK